MFVSKTLAYDYLYGCVAYVGTTEAPRQSEWLEYLRFARQHLPPTGEDARCLVVERGPGPNAGQRKALQEVTAGRSARVAVLTRSLLARGVVTALSWVKPGYRAFPPEDMPAALEYLGLREIEARAVRERVEALIGELDAQQGSPAQGVG